MDKMDAEYDSLTCYSCGRQLTGHVTLLCPECRKRAREIEADQAAEWDDNERD